MPPRKRTAGPVKVPAKPRARAAAVVDDAQLLAAQARRNALRTFLQGLAIDVLVAVAILVAQLVSSPLSAWQGWAAVGIALARTVLGAAAAYVMRRFVDNSRVPTPLPIGPAAAPVELEDGTVVEEDDAPAP
jgi:hypothetical protein